MTEKQVKLMKWALGPYSLKVWNDLLELQNIFSLYPQGQFHCFELLKEEFECSSQGEVGPNIIDVVLEDSYLDQTNQSADPATMSFVVWKLLFCVMEFSTTIVPKQEKASPDTSYVLIINPWCRTIRGI